jgi:serine/threonine protein kinase
VAEQHAVGERRSGRTTVEHPVAIGTQVGPYRIIGDLGGGGMGLVYRAVHAQLDRPTAIKVLRPELGRSVWALDRFLTEARAASGVRHPGIVEIYDYGIMPSGRPFIAMELLEGTTLGCRLADRGRMSPADAAGVARQIAGALAAAHARGIVHCDLKPENAFLVRDPRSGALDQVKLLDFGIAKRETQATQVMMRRAVADMVLGTPAYMSPEQCRGDADCDHRTDLYSLGCILFEMLSGQPPYGRAPTEMLFAAHLVAPVPDLTVDVEIPGELARLVTSLLAKHPDGRPRSALEVVAVIDRWLAAGAPVAAERRGSLRMALGAARQIGSWCAAIGLWHQRLRTPCAGGDEPVASHGTLDDSARPRLATGTAPRAGMSRAPTELLPVAVDVEGDTRLVQLSPNGLVRCRAAIDDESERPEVSVELQARD